MIVVASFVILGQIKYTPHCIYNVEEISSSSYM